jgi:outer membrane protein assembly factor BamB
MQQISALGADRKRTHSLPRWSWALALIAVTLIAAGCGRQIPPYWPDLAVADQTVYVAEMNGQVFALDAETGNTVWSYPIIERSSGGLLSGCSAPTPSDGPFFAAPAVGEDLIFLGSAGEKTSSLFRRSENTAGLRALNTLGTLQWEFKGTEDRTVAPPALADGVVYLPSSDNNVYAVDVDARTERWVFETENWVWASPLVVDNTVYIASMDHILYAVDAQTGTEKWRFDGAPSALPAAPALADGVLYFGSLAGRVYAVAAQDGEPLWDHKVNGGVWATPWIQNGALYFGTLQGNIYALSTADGSELWQKSVSGEVRGTPALANGILYFGCEDGRLYAFDAQEGTEVISPLGQTLEDASIYTSPVFDGTRLYVVATNGQVFALDPERNAIVWQTNPLNTEQEE